MTPDEMYEMTSREFFNKYEGFQDHQQWLQREEYERMRLQTAALLQVHVKKGRQLKPKDVFKFDWDHPDVEKTPFDREQAEMRMKKLHLKGKLLHSGGL